MEQQQHVMEFRLPDLGEGLADAELVSWQVQVGDTVELNQVIAEVETAKAQVALPSPFAGTVVELLAQAGDTVLVGAPLIRIGTAVEAPTERQAVLVGYGPDSEPVSRRARAAAAPASGTRSGAPVGDSMGRPAATPGARKLAREIGVDLTAVAGSGPEGLSR